MKKDRWGAQTTGPTSSRAGNPKVRNNLLPQKWTPSIEWRGQYVPASSSANLARGSLEKAMVAPWTAIQEQRYIRFVWQIRSSAGSILDEAFNIFAFYDGRIEWSYKSFNWVMMSPVDHIGPYPVETTRLSAAFAIVVQTYIFLRGSE